MVHESIASELVTPVHASSFFSVSRTGEIHERLIYEYDDPAGYYPHVLADDSLYETEVSKLWDNMQYFLDKERVEINGQRVRSVVRHTDIIPKGTTSVIGVIFVIDFVGNLLTGRNKIETWLEEEEAPYDFDIIWRFPIGTTIVEIESLLDYEISEDIVVLWAVEGQQVGGYERMVFDIKMSTDECNE
ncbi:MAG: hypothetical protein K9W43_07225 [Candidatus Thorarchaeota archaeon]|nr:hypothetical protein [Candidatus Thorarchaeota archaeon]